MVMTEHMENRRNRGFSLVETLAVVAILAILLSLSAVAAAYYRDYLKITELDNAAREIYMAAENRAVLLDGGGQLDSALGISPLAGDGTPAQPIHITKEAAADRGLLTAGAIDPALLEGDFYLFYDAASGAVTDVFYAEQDIHYMDQSSPIAFLDAWSQASRDDRMRPGDAGPMLGYYGGEQAEREDYTPLPAPEVLVEVENADRLTVKVTFLIPEAARKLMGGYDESKLNANTHRTVTLSYPGRDPVTLYDSSGGNSGYASYSPINTSPYYNRVIFREETIASGRVSYTWVLDELDTNPAQDNGRHFRQLFAAGLDAAPPCGGDFTITAEIKLSAPGRRSASASGSDTGNSLFAEHSGGTAARLENLRHLQNLDAKTSAVGGKTSAILLADIDCCGRQARAPYGLYAFRPIDNRELRSFDGGWSAGDGKNRRNKIMDLLVTEESAQGKLGAGLFATTYGSAPTDPVKFTGVYLTDAVVSAAKPAGALVGCAGMENRFQDIRVVNGQITCTDSRPAVAAAGGVVGGGTYQSSQATDGVSYYSAKNQHFQRVYAVNTSAACAAGAAGGIAGRIGGESEYISCRVYWEPEEGQQDLRSLLGSDTTQYRYQITGHYAGGLAGHFDRTAYATSGKDAFTVRKSFASSMVNGTRYTGGLLGGSMSVKISLQDSYADCYLTGGQAAGLIGNTTHDTQIVNCYAAGFIGMKETSKAAGLCLGPVQITAENTYSVMSYPGVSENSIIFPLVETAGTSELQNTYYLRESIPSADPEDGTRVSYDKMSGRDFAAVMGGLFEFKSVSSGTAAQSSNPYNLQEKQNLTKYSFPGLKGLPHYGDWIAYFKEPSLVYYEQDSTGKIGFSGGNARELIGRLEDDKQIAIKTDGYAVALLKKDLPAGGRFQVAYTTLKEDGTGGTTETCTYVTGTPSGPKEIRLLEAVWERQEGGGTIPDQYWLAPLPTELVIGALTDSGSGRDFQALTSKDFYQYLFFTTDIPLESAGGGFASGEYFYNPHFAETVKPYVPTEDGTPLIDWDAVSGNPGELVHQYITQTLTPGTRPVSVSVRTPRHFFHLSRYEDYYNNPRLSFQQGLRLDGGENVYTGYRNIQGYDLLRHDSRGFQLQSPTGTQADPFLGSYNGNCLPIRRIAFEIPKNDRNRVCAGLFGSSGGTLQNIVYSLNPSEAEPPGGAEQKNDPRSIIFYSSEKDTYLGALAGLNTLTGKITNCAVEGVNLTTQIYSTQIYIGGLCGMNAGLVQNSAAESAYLHVDASNYGRACTGGLTGSNSGQIHTSYAVGRLAANASQDNAPVLLAGFAGVNSGNISSSYSAMDLKTDGVNASAYGFCGPSSSGRLAGTFYLNDGNFSYRGEEFLASLEDGGNAQPVSYIGLTAETPPVSGMDTLGGKDPERIFPYPTGVKKDGASHHYGGWPKPLNLGNMGVYYWEELRLPGQAPSYHVSLLAVNPGENAAAPKTVSKLSTLSTAHDQRGEVVRFGYGIYNRRSSNSAVLTTVTLADTPYPLLYTHSEQESGVKFDQGLYETLELQKLEGRNAADKLVDDELARLMTYELDKEGKTQFAFHSFHTYGQNENRDGGQGGLYPGSSSSTPNGTLTLHQGGNQEVTITFALNPLFADALAVELPKDGGKWSAASQDVPIFARTADGKLSGKTPGSGEDVPYGVRSIDQLQFIDWNLADRGVDTVLELKGAEARGIASFPYLSSSDHTGKYHWKQSYDIKGETRADGTYKTYSPIAEYYDTTNTNENRGYLDGWFGGIYDGSSYVIENVNIQGSTASCAGLFGVVYNGTLKNIVLYSSTGESYVKSVYDEKTSSQWYAIGALAGVAASHNADGTPGETAVENCAVSGYQIEVKSYTAMSSQTWGGVGVGGLLGLSNMSLSGCTANTGILLANGTVANDNIRTGGLVGSCQGSIKNCYAGGSISLGKNSDISMGQKGIYIGGIVGGSYMKPLQIGSNTNRTIGFVDDPGTAFDPTKGWTDNELISCYSYVRLPSLEDHAAIKSLYVIGGTGEINPPKTSDGIKNHGTTTYKNCYFLTSTVLEAYEGNEDSYLKAIQERGAKTDLGAKEPDKTDSLLVEPIKETYRFRKNQAQSPFVDTTPIVLGGTSYYYESSAHAGKNGSPLFVYSLETGNQPHVYTHKGWLVGYPDVPDVTADRSDSRLTVTIPGVGTSNSNVTGLTYEQLAGMQKDIPGKDPGLDIYDLLPDTFSPVTTETEDGVHVPGKYSYPPATSPHLRDRDYPFPTILTKETFHVHYGDWPLKGFRRQTLFDGEGRFSLLGGSPIETDLFVNGSAPYYQEHLVLTDGVGRKGSWSFDWESVKQAEEAGQDASAVKLIARTETPKLLTGDQIPNEQERQKPYYLFTLTPLRDGTDVLYISYTDTTGVVYTLPVTVHVTAAVELRPSRLFMFPSDTVEIAVKATDKTGHPMAERLEHGKLTLKGDPNCGSSGYLSARTLRPEEAGSSPPGILFTTAVPPEALAESLTLGANANFTYTVTTPNSDDPDHPKVQDYGGGSGGDIRIDVIRPWTVEFPEPESPEDPLTCVVTFPGSLPISDEAQNETDVLLFDILEAKVQDMAGKPALTTQTGEPGTVYTLTYGPEVKAVPPTRLSITLTMTSRDHILIPENEPQTHALTLEILPKESPDAPDQPAARSLEALPPAADGQDQPARRRRWKQRYQRRRCTPEGKS